jgi:serine/threonine-protein kinase RsbW
VKDEGRGFNPESVPDPLEEKNLLKTSGRGVFLMRSLMDKVTYNMTPEGTEVELVIDLKHLG